MECIVKNCTGDIKIRNISHEITFHLFPKERNIRQAWLESLYLMEFEVRDDSVVCSKHFSKNDFYEDKQGQKKLRHGSVPIVDESEDLDAPAATRVCRICLAVNVKMYNISENQLGQAYQQIFGIMWEEKDSMPQKFCWECAGRLYSCHKFFNKALKSHKLLMGVLRTTSYLKLRDIKSISRSYYNLQSSLMQQSYNHEIGVYLPAKQEKTEQENPEEALEQCIAEPLDSGIASIEVKVEKPLEFYDEFGDNLGDQFDDSDDNVKLSEVVDRVDKTDSGSVVKPKVKVKVKKKKVKIERDRKKVKEKRKNEEEENPSSTMDKYKTSDVKRRKSDGLDESLFNITTLSYEEQIAEIQKRQETYAYKSAVYKCTICYRGFLIKDRYDAHAVRHSDASGAFECFICKTRLKTGRALRKHLTAQHTEKFSCKGCPFVTRNRGVAREHEKWHAGTKYQCPHCPSEFDKLTTYMGHIRIKHVSDFVCELCGFTFVSKKGIEVHKKKKHRLSDKTVPVDGPYCCVCDVTFVSEEAHSRHLKLSSRHSSDNDPNRIRNDSQSINTERNGRVMRKIERRPVINPKDPGDRERRPEPSGPVTCEQCGIQLRDLRLYAQHFRRAHPDKNRTKYPAMKTPCMCEQCGRIFQSMALLKDHMWVHTGEKRFKCSSCDKSFTQKTNLVFHMRVHSAQRPTYECPLCGKHFAFFNNRRRHMFIHTGLKPFKCDTCGKCFTTSGEQRAHVEHVHLKKPWPKRARGQRQSRDMQEDWHKCAMQHMED
ncbi:unnamed protein product [Chilo suppressalis]|uniref:Uncharacterized protein n=1 Tax=Chilo suppressalis TaxID=168631 RepID=A0ABN8BBB4_CHISP|nr:unnamed protein product [Chilo suppressalis]